MRARTAFWSAMVSWLVVIACAACESNEQLGSACPGGVCPAQSAVQGPACLAGSVGEIAVRTGFLEFCPPRALPTDDGGRVQCEVTWSLPLPEHADAGVPTRCSDREFLSGSTQVPALCVVRHLTGAERAAGGEGWYYDSDEFHPCGVTGAIRFTDGARPTVGLSASFRCAVLEARDENGDVQAITADECASPPENIDPSSVGDACRPGIIPVSGFDPREAYVEIGTPECETGTCIVYLLDGDLSEGCQQNADGTACTPPAVIDASVYCSCRCDLPEGVEGEECSCPDRFSCVELIAEGADTVRGGYCVRNDGLQ